MLKAYKIRTKIDEGGFGIYIAENAGRAKTNCVSAMKDAYRDATYSWIIYCLRVPEFDYLGEEEKLGCVAWQSCDGEKWQIDRGHWWGLPDIAPVTFPEDSIREVMDLLAMAYATAGNGEGSEG